MSKWTLLPVVLAGLLIPLAAAQAAAEGFKVTTDRTVDNSSLESIVADVIRLAGAKTNDEKAIAIHEYLHHTIFHWAYATEKAPQSVGPLKVINVYGWALCGGQHTVLKALFETAGWKCRYVGWPGHTTIEVNYDGKWHYFDTFLKCYYWTKDKSHVAGQQEIAADPSIVLDAVADGRASPENLCCGDPPQGVVDGCKAGKDNGDAKGWASVTWRDDNYSPALTLRSGASVRLDWKSEPNGFAITGKAPQHSCGTKDFRNDKVLGPLMEHYGPRNWSDGLFVYKPDFSKAADVADIDLKDAQASGSRIAASSGKGVAIFKVGIPYCFVTAKLDAAFEGDGKLALSLDAGKTWADTAAGDITALVKQKYEVWIKAEFTVALTKFAVEGQVEHNRSAQPYLYNGKNQVTVATKDNKLPTGAVLKVTYVYQEANAGSANRQFNGNGVTYGEPKTVSKEIDKLPFTFTIDVDSNEPPKMVSLERAVVAK
ncbi:MAG: hypothetical protein HY291_13595 [Planctomycetes bacterium]|nr:hypothetical protein [Planctomycetota bacterium]